MKLCIIGAGHVGLVTGACFAEVGHHVICIDNDQRKVDMLAAGKIPLYEPQLEELLSRNIAAKRLFFSNSVKAGVDASEVIFLAVPTPLRADGTVDLSCIEQVVREIAPALGAYRIIVDKSTVPVKTGEKMAEIIRRHNAASTLFDIVSNPEFLREGSAVRDTLHPDRIVIGSSSQRAIALMRKIYEPFSAPLLITDVNSAELIKHAANSFLALKISYINMVARICEANKADVKKVADGIGLDKRIGRGFLDAGIGYGGSCFPKDVATFIAICQQQLGRPFGLLREVQKINDTQLEYFISKIRGALQVLEGRKIAVWGLTFKPDTDDIRNSVAVALVNLLISEGVIVQVYDPKGMEKSRRLWAKTAARFASSPLEAVQGAEALVIATEWKEFTSVDLREVKARMQAWFIFDGRNLLNPSVARQFGFSYYSIGRF
ncbi:MAG: UDP-glucose/GDP-mannose dehydrogenase family protein [Candidatus Xiphinematobacter sp.]|nr:MAG: UDP-glucose/GDP-mannose dehydrogenase family protein [Candidatus Xiphinematobacter sp.]